MVHTYTLNGYHIAVDGNSGSDHISTVTTRRFWGWLKIRAADQQGDVMRKRW